MDNSRAGVNLVGVGCGFTVVDCEETIVNVDAAMMAVRSVEENMMDVTVDGRCESS